MRTILITAYAVNPYKGSEEGTGWNLIRQAARYHTVIAVTRKNNRGDIEKYTAANPADAEWLARVQFLHFDLPAWMIRWKKGPLLSALYFYIWQFSVAWWLKSKRLSFDIAHSLNFHSNWTPSFLWILGKPFVWGPVGNHPLVPRQYILRSYGFRAWMKDRTLWMVKSFFWYLDPFVLVSRIKAKKIFCVNSQSKKKLRIPANKALFMPAVASEIPAAQSGNANQVFTVLSVGRFVPLKGFDLTIRSFAAFYQALTPAERIRVHLHLIGTGPEKGRLRQMVKEAALEDAVTISEWMPRKQVIETFREAAVFSFPSHEGAGMVVPEAMSYGVPVICLDNYGPGEYVHPESELKVAHADYQSTVANLAYRLRKLFLTPRYYAYESALAEQRFAELFRWDIKGDQLRDVYNSLVA